MANSTASKRGSVTEVGGMAINSTFANSKFFQKRLKKAAIKIQSLCRAFLVQARCFRQCKLEPRFQDLKSCDARQAEEIKRIQDQKVAEMEDLPRRMKMEFEESEQFIVMVKKEIADYKDANAELKVEHKELKKKNKELSATASTNNALHFKLEVSSNKMSNENKSLEKTKETYFYLLEGGNEQKEELEKMLLQQVHKRHILKRYIGKVLKAVEEKAIDGGGDGTSSSSAAKDDSGKRTKKSRRATSKPKPTKSTKEDASFDWESHQSFSVLDIGSDNSEDEDEGGDSLGGLQTGDSQKGGGSMGHMSFLMDHTIEDSSSESNNNHNASSVSKKESNPKSSSKSGPNESEASFDWATQSYNWANKSIEIKPEALSSSKVPRRQRRHSAMPPSGSSSSSKKITVRRSDSQDSNSSIKMGSSSKSKSKGNNNSALRELLRELKAMKKELKP